MDYKAIAKGVFEKEIQALELMMNSLDERFEDIMKVLSECAGKVVWIGMGKSGHVAKKVAATMSSLGTPAFYIHPAEAQHGDLGMIDPKDVVILISYSGETEEITKLISPIRLIGSTIIGITGRANSQLAQNSDIVQVLPDLEEACSLRLAPTSSTTVMMAYGDALAVALATEKGFTKERFALYHPSGALGRKLLLRVGDVMLLKEESAIVRSDATFKDAVAEMCIKSSRIVSILADDGKLLGILTDGDIRRDIEKGYFDSNTNIMSICTQNPKAIDENALVADAYILMKNCNISAMPVISDNDIFVGSVGFREIMKAGIEI